VGEVAIGTEPRGVSGAVDPVIGALFAVGAVTALRMPLLIEELAHTNDHSEGTTAVLRQLRDGLSGLALVEVLWWLIFLAAGVLWIRWQESIHAKLYQAHVEGLLRPPWLSMLAWLVPVVALVVPGLLVGRLLRGARAGPEGDARSAEPALAVWFWWLVFAPGWVVCSLGSFFRSLAGASLDRDTVSSIPTGDMVGLLRTADTMLLIGSIIVLLALPLAVVVHLQVDRAFLRTMSSWAPPRPDLGEPSPLH
jgi:hypothetical protein